MGIPGGVGESRSLCGLFAGWTPSPVYVFLSGRQLTPRVWIKDSIVMHFAYIVTIFQLM